MGKADHPFLPGNSMVNIKNGPYIIHSWHILQTVLYGRETYFDIQPPNSGTIQIFWKEMGCRTVSHQNFVDDVLKLPIITSLQAKCCVGSKELHTCHLDSKHSGLSLHPFHIQQQLTNSILIIADKYPPPKWVAIWLDNGGKWRTVFLEINNRIKERTSRHC